EDAKQHSLGMLYFLKQLPASANAEPFKKLALIEDFATPDLLPPKPYIREGLRLHALSMLREQDIRTPHPEPRWAQVMPYDGLFGFQFNIDFHPTRRQFLNDDPTGPWALIHTPTRNWSTHTDRAMLSARSLVPVRVDRLIGSSKNLGVTSITSAALRLHGQMMHAGQAAGALAAMSLEQRKQPREIVASPKLVEQLQRRLVLGEPLESKLQQRLRKPRRPRHGLLLWPYHDLHPSDEHFAAATLLTAWRILLPLEDSVHFKPDQKITIAEALATVRRAAATRVGSFKAPAEWPTNDAPTQVANVTDLTTVLKSAGFEFQSPAVSGSLTRAKLARVVWAAVEAYPTSQPEVPEYLQPGHDTDRDGIEDRQDPWPFER
ncbi:MAG: FAD-dependent oxidoreductase, partial [Planctomycetaceae bacterium]|nr:FAD-dependent oxidoreductase [Planctomycetaceae bacterium]